jgi:hypothetical protein
MTSSQYLLDPVRQCRDSWQALKLSGDYAFDAHVREELVPFNARKRAAGWNIHSLSHPVDRGYALHQIVLNVIHVTRPLDLIADMERESKIANACNAKAAGCV